MKTQFKIGDKVTFTGCDVGNLCTDCDTCEAAKIAEYNNGVVIGIIESNSNACNDVEVNIGLRFLYVNKDSLNLFIEPAQQIKPESSLIGDLM